MTCFKPMPAVRMDDGSVKFVERGAVHYSMELPCQQCIGCRLDRGRDWTIRGSNELVMHGGQALFVTATYDPNLPEFPAYGSLFYPHVQMFHRRLRRYFQEEIRAGKMDYRYMVSGEYGEKPMDLRIGERFARSYVAASERSEGVRGAPHFHMICFGLSLPDAVYYSKTQSGFAQYSSEILSSFWPHGRVLFCDVTPETIAYVAGYHVKKVVGRDAQDFYRKADVYTGEIVNVQPEMFRVSLKPAIGRTFLDRFGKSDVFAGGYAVLNGRKLPVPKYYLKVWDDLDAVAREEYSIDRLRFAQAHDGDSTPERLGVREVCAIARGKDAKQRRGSFR